MIVCSLSKPIGNRYSCRQAPIEYNEQLTNISAQNQSSICFNNQVNLNICTITYTKKQVKNVFKLMGTIYVHV